GGEVAPGGTKDDHHATGHVLAAVVSHAFDHGGGAGGADAEALTDLAADVQLAARGAVGDDVAGDDVLLRGEGRRLVRPDDDAPARQTLGEVVVGVALQAQGDAARYERAERLARRAHEGQVDGVVRQ